MTPKRRTILPDLLADPFGEREAILRHPPMQLLGGRFQFESNSRELLRLVDSAYSDVPPHRLSAVAPRLNVKLLLRSEGKPQRLPGGEPPPLGMFSGVGLLGGATHASEFVVVSPRERAALVVVSSRMRSFPYHTRYELIEFAVFTLAARAQGLASLHAACVGEGGRGVLLMGPSGAGKSTVALQCLLQGLDFLSEDSVFVAPDGLLATGVANFLHVRADSLRWVERERDAVAVRRSPVIRRRTGVEKFELNVRRGSHRLASSPLRIAAVVFLSPQKAGDGPLLRSLAKPALLAQLVQAQAYAAAQPGWPALAKRLAGLDAFEMRRGRHPRDAVEALRSLLRPRQGRD